MRGVFAGSIMIALLAGIAGAQNPSDYVLESYPVDGAQFVRDGKVSPFWIDWAGRDYVDMTPAANAYVTGANSFSGISDAEMIMRSGYDATGLYLYFEVHDNIWMPPAAYDADGIDFLIDKISSQEIRDANPFDLYIQPSWNWTLTYYSVQYQVSLGGAGAALPTSMYINYFSGSAMSFNTVNLTQLPVDYSGWDMDIATVNDNVRIMEWKVPWTWVGAGSGIGSMPDKGRLIAISGGYNDRDSPGQTGERNLRWKEKDPFNDCLDKVPSHPFCDAWGDVMIGGSTAVEPHTALPIGANTKIVSTRYYTITGKSIAKTALASISRGTMLLRRDLMGDNTVRSGMFRVW